MIDLAVFVPACFAVNLAFGPNNLLALTHGARMGVRFAVVASLARLMAFAPMIAASALGLGVLLAASATVFTAVKLAGAAYLVWLGVRLLRTPRPDATRIDPVRPTLARAFRNEGLVAISNPKAILVFAAFFPQFVDTQAYWTSYALLAGIFLPLEVVAIFIYASLGRYAASFAASRMHWFQRASGAGMVAFGILLLLARKPGPASA
jgi:threonine/homoserine/homoserine lactone efflux protein